MNILISPTEEKDMAPLYMVFTAVCESGDTLAYLPSTSMENFRYIWKPPGGSSYTATMNDTVAGGYVMKPQWPDRGSHVATAMYIVSPDFQGQGIGRALGEHSLKTAKQLGFTAMQFNMVVGSNKAVQLWLKLGFKIIGTLPCVFNHARDGFTDAYVMHRFLADE